MIQDVSQQIFGIGTFLILIFHFQGRKEEETVLSSRVARIHSCAQIPSYFSSSKAWHEG